jgi:hypothetical protein
VHTLIRRKLVDATLRLDPELGAPAALAALVAACTQAEPTQRPPMAEVLRQLLALTEPPTPGWGEAEWTSVGTMALIGACGGLLLIVLICLWLC